MPSRHEIEHVVGHAVRQRLADSVGTCRSRPRRLVIDESSPRSLRHGLAVDVQHAVDHLDLVAGQADHALDVVGLVVARELEDDDVAALRLRRPDAAREQVRPNGKRVAAVAVGVFGDEQIVADQQRRDHRAGRNVEGLEQEDPDDQSASTSAWMTTLTVS